MATALIGYTGLIGRNLLAQTGFDQLYRSTNIYDIKGGSFDCVACAAAPGAKWIANKEPEKDMASIQRLMDSLKEIKTKEFLLISTIDVYPRPYEADEDTPIDSSEATPYGRHRRILEEFIQQKFNAVVIRLPGLFGKGLKKNIIYDFLHNNELEKIHQDGVFQFYNLDYLWRDIQKARENKLKLVNFATEPVSVKEVARECFGIKFNNNLNTPAPNYRTFTKYGILWGREDHFIYSKSDTLKSIKRFVSSQWGNPV